LTSQPAPNARIPIIIDTDIGEDLDDLLMLSVALNSPEFEILAVTTVDGDTDARGRIARRMTAAYGQGHIPVCAGYRRSMPQGNGPIRPGTAITQGAVAPGEDGLPPACEMDAGDLIAQIAADRPGEVSLINIGAMTNTGQALVRHPETAENLKAIVFPAVLAEIGRERFIDWNFCYDPVAAAVVARSGANWILVSWGLCRGLGPDMAQARQIAEAGLETADLITLAIAEWRKNKREITPETPPHGADLKALAYLLGQADVESVRGWAEVTVASGGKGADLRVVEDPEGPHTLVRRLAPERAEELHELFVQRLLSPPYAGSPG